MKWLLSIYNVGTREVVKRLVEADTHDEALDMIGTVSLPAGQWVVIGCTSEFVLGRRIK